MNDPLSQLTPLLSAGHLSAPTPNANSTESNAEAARKFETMIVKMMMKQLQQSMGGGLFSDGHLAMFQDHFNEALANEIEEAGGLGLAAQLELSLSAAPGSRKPAVNALPRFLPSEHAAQLSWLNRNRPGTDDALDPNLPVAGRITSGFGLRKDPLEGDTRRHAGMDIAAPHGTPIRPAAHGTVAFAGPASGYGNLVVVEHPDGSETRYAHCAEIKVQAGQAVTATDIIATVGSTGRATGAHVHFEVRKNGRSIDPEAWLRDRPQKTTQQSSK